MIYAPTNIDQISERKENYNGLLLGLFLSGDMMIKVINTFIPVNNMLVIYYMTIILTSFVVNRFKFKVKYLFFYFSIAILFITSLLRVHDTTYTIQYFIYFTVFYFASGILQSSFNVKKIFKTVNTVNILYALYLFFIVMQSYNIGSLDFDYTMNLSYTSLIGIASYLLSFQLKNYNQKRAFLLINSICVIVELYFMIFISNNRGALIALSVLIALILIKRTDNLLKRYATIGGFATLGYLLFENLYNVLLSVSNLLARFNMSSELISKTLWKLQFEDVSSGRFDLYNDAWAYFLESPLVGKGVGYYPAIHNGQYPHNILLDVLSSLGLVLAIVVAVFIVYAFLKIVNGRNKDINILTIFLFTLSIPELLFSKTLWMSPFLWPLVVLLAIKPRDKKTNTKE